MATASAISARDDSNVNGATSGQAGGPFAVFRGVDGRELGMATLKVAAVAAAVGAVVGIAENFFSQKNRAKTHKVLDSRLAIPATLQELAPTATQAFTMLSRHPGLKLEPLGRAMRRASNIVELYQKLATADPESVGLNLHFGAIRLQAAMHTQLSKCYVESRIPTMLIDGERVPVPSTLREHHVVISNVVADMVYNVGIVHEAKLKDARAARMGKPPNPAAFTFHV